MLRWAENSAVGAYRSKQAVAERKIYEKRNIIVSSKDKKPCNSCKKKKKNPVIKKKSVLRE